MFKKYFLGFFVVSIVFISGCSDNYILLPKSTSTLTTINNTNYDPSRTFQLQSFADSCSIISSIDLDNLNCSSGDNALDYRYNATSGLWTTKCCDFKASKCYWYNVSDILVFNESKQYQDSILGSKYEDEYGVMCCNTQMSECVWQKPGLNGSYDSCGAEYDQLVTSVKFNETGNNQWGVVACIDGFM